MKEISKCLLLCTTVKYLLKVKDGYYISQLKLGFCTHKRFEIFFEKDLIRKENKGRTSLLFLTAKGEFVRTNLQAILDLLGDSV